MAHVGVVFSFRVAPKDDEKVEPIMREIFDAMAVEEFPTGAVLTYTLFRDPAIPGKWMMFEYFTKEGSDRHSAGPLMMKRGTRLVELMIEPYERILLDPVIALGCGEPIPRD
jgi:quinol monooxygenase YgiN